MTQPDVNDSPAEAAEPTCCGEKWAGANEPKKAGTPLINACALCPRSPTYWRRAEVERQTA